MKKILCTLLALVLIIGTAIPAHAVTPKLEIPDIPEVPEINPDFSWIDFDAIFDKWFSNPIRIESVRLLGG